MDTFFYLLLVAATVTVMVGLLVQMVGAVLFAALTVGVGVNDWWTGRRAAPGSQHDVSA